MCLDTSSRFKHTHTHTHTSDLSTLGTGQTLVCSERASPHRRGKKVCGHSAAAAGRSESHVFHGWGRLAGLRGLSLSTASLACLLAPCPRPDQQPCGPCAWASDGSVSCLLRTRSLVHRHPPPTGWGRGGLCAGREREHRAERKGVRVCVVDKGGEECGRTDGVGGTRASWQSRSATVHTSRHHDRI